MSSLADVLDLPALQLRLKGKKSRLVRLAAVFMQYYTGQLQEIERAIAQGDSLALYHSAHTFKGTVTSFEAGTASALARELEHRGNQGNLEGAATLLEQLKGEAERLRARLEELLADCEAWPE